MRHARLQARLQTWVCKFATGLWSVNVPKTRKHVSVASYLCSFSCANINGIFPICFTADSFLYLLVFAIDEKKMHWPVSILGLTKAA